MRENAEDAYVALYLREGYADILECEQEGFQGTQYQGVIGQLAPVEGERQGVEEGPFQVRS